MAKIKTDRVSDWRRAQALKLRTEENMTYQQIADSMGVSKQYISQLLCGTVKEKGYQRVRESAFPYPALINWMRENQVTQMKLVQKMGYASSPGNYNKVSQRIKRGNLRKTDIDKLLEVTGLSYEKLFGGNA